MTDTRHRDERAAQDESLDEARRRARDEVQQLEARRQVLSTAEAAAADALERRRARAEDRRSALEAELAASRTRVAELKHGVDVSLGVARNLRKAAQLMLRVLLATVALLGLMALLATEPGLSGFLVGGLEVAAVWFLGDVVDRREHVDE